MRMTMTVATAAALSVLILAPASGTGAQEATPAAYSCETVATGSTTAEMPMGQMGDMEGMPTGTPMAGMNHMAMEIDQMYIAMMIPHHQSIIAMAQAALPRLTDERLREIAQAVIDTQQPEIEELQRYHEQFYGDANPMPMDEGMTAAMSEMMPGMSETMDKMDLLMNAEALVAAYCAADDPDLAFIDLTIPHHLMAIEAAEATRDQAVHPEIRDNAQRVIDTQQQEIETLTEIRQELTGEATPGAS